MKCIASWSSMRPANSWGSSPEPTSRLSGPTCASAAARTRPSNSPEIHIPRVFSFRFINTSLTGRRPVGAAPRKTPVTTPRETPLRADPFRMTLLIFAIIAFMYFAGEVLKPLALSVLLSFALAPAARLLERCRLPRAAAVVMTVLLSLGMLAGIGYVVGQQLTSLANRLPNYQENI